MGKMGHSKEFIHVNFILNFILVIAIHACGRNTKERYIYDIFISTSHLTDLSLHDFLITCTYIVFWKVTYCLCFQYLTESQSIITSSKYYPSCCQKNLIQTYQTVSLNQCVRSFFHLNACVLLHCIIILRKSSHSFLWNCYTILLGRVQYRHLSINLSAL